MSNETKVFSTPDDIEYFRLASCKGQLKLEQVGLKSSGGPIRPRIANELKLKPRASYDKFINAIQAKMDALIEKKLQQSPNPNK